MPKAKPACSVIVYKQDDNVKFCDGKAIAKVRLTSRRFAAICSRHEKRHAQGHTLAVVDGKGELWILGSEISRSA